MKCEMFAVNPEGIRNEQWPMLEVYEWRSGDHMTIHVISVPIVKRDFSKKSFKCVVFQMCCLVLMLWPLGNTRLKLFERIHRY